MSAATMNEMDRLRRERDEARAERGALAAHVERLFEAFNRIAIEGEDGMYSPRELEDELCAIFSDAPAISLDRLKAQAKAEAFENLANYEGHWTQRDMEAIASDYRRRWKEVCEERDVISTEHAEMDQERSRLRLELIKAEIREHALAAHVERIRYAWWIDDTGIHDKRIEHVRLPYLRYESVNRAIMDAPTTSLDRLKTQWQAEALEQAADGIEPLSYGATSLRNRAAELRRQAEGGE